MTPTQIATVIAALMQADTHRSEAVARPADTPDIDHGFCLVVADRGHVWVGNARDEGDYTIVTDARIVRRFGTDRGLNQIANEGPTAKTIVGAPATLKVARWAIIAIIPCEASAWNGK